MKKNRKKVKLIRKKKESDFFPRLIAYLLLDWFYIATFSLFIGLPLLFLISYIRWGDPFYCMKDFTQSIYGSFGICFCLLIGSIWLIIYTNFINAERDAEKYEEEVEEIVEIEELEKGGKKRNEEKGKEKV